MTRGSSTNPRARATTPRSQPTRQPTRKPTVRVTPATAKKKPTARKATTARKNTRATPTRSRSTNRVRRVARPQAPAVFWLIVATVGLLCLIGLIMVLSASSVTANRVYGTALYYFKRQAQWLVLGLIALFGASRFDYHRLAKLAPMLMTVTSVGLVVVLFHTPFTKSVNGSARWFDIAGVSFQPSELAKLSVILWVATMLHQRRRELGDWRRTILPITVGLGVLGLLIILEPDLGTVVMLAAIAAVMLVVAGARLDVLAIIGVGSGALLFGLSQLGYHRARWDSLDPWKDKLGTGWQSLQSQVGVASGGLLGCLAVIVAFGILLGAGIKVSRGAPDMLGSLLAIGIATWIGVQAFVNIGVTLGVLPNKGVTLPFVSYGGSSLLITLFTTGVLLNIARQST